MNWLKNLLAKIFKVNSTKQQEIVKQEPVLNPAIPQFKIGTPDWYLDKYKKAYVPLQFRAEIDGAVAKILNCRMIYEQIEQELAIPWFVVACIHHRESSLSFTKCLHNGDPLPGPTKRVPKGRGPFKSWKDAAIDALTLDNYPPMPKIWNVPSMLKFMEQYNGGGYLKRGMPSCYLWSYTDVVWPKGRFTYDGVFDPNADANDYPGVVSILKRLEALGVDVYKVNIPSIK